MPWPPSLWRIHCCCCTLTRLCPFSHFLCSALPTLLWKWASGLKFTYMPLECNALLWSLQQHFKCFLSHFLLVTFFLTSPKRVQVMQGTEGAEGEWSVLWKEAVRKGGEKVAYTSGGVTKTSLKSKNIFVQETLNVKTLPWICLKCETGFTKSILGFKPLTNF